MQQTHFRTWELALLPARTLVLNMQDAILSELSRSPCTITAQELLYPQEAALLTVLLNAYPDYAPYADLYIAVYATPQAQTREMIKRAIQEHALDRIMHPIRVLLSRSRAKLRTFGLSVEVFRGLGYIITTSSESGTIAET